MANRLIEIEFKLLGTDYLLRGINQLKSFHTEPKVKDTWESIAELVLIEMQQNSPTGITGELRSSFREEVGVFQNTVYGIVYSDVLYAPFQERGTDPYWPNWDNLEDWAAAKGLTGYQVAMSIATTGIIALKYAEKSVKGVETSITDLVGDVIVELWEGTY